MLTRLLQFSLSQRLFMLLLVAAVAAGGWLAFTKLPIDAFLDEDFDAWLKNSQ